MTGLSSWEEQSIGDQFSGHKHAAESYGRHFLYVLSTFTLRPEEGNVIPLNLIPRRKCTYCDLLTSATHIHVGPQILRAFILQTEGVHV